MRESVPRLALVLAGLVAIAALSLGIKDYLEPGKKTNDRKPATPTIERSDITTRQKKTTSAKTRPQRISATEANAPAPSQTATDNLERPLIGQEFSKSEARAIVLTGNGRNGEKEQGVHRELEAAMDDGNRVDHERGTIQNPRLPSCLPLPNGTELGDVDAPYYDNWAGEYCER
jgi:hypothetical protein